jgi:hypothetical protein
VRTSSIRPMLALAALSAAMLGPGAAPAAAACTRITRLPFTAATSGTYCLVRSLSTETEGITIAADNVAIDLHGFGLTRTGSLLAPATRVHDAGVKAVNRRNITLRNGHIQGFGYGVLISDSAGRSQGHVIERLRVTGSRQAGIALTGTRSLITACRVEKTGGATSIAVGISQAGSASILTSNVVSDTHVEDPEGYAAGIDLTHGYNRLVRRNTVVGVTGGRNNYGIRIGLGLTSAAGVGAAMGTDDWLALARDNAVRGAGDPFVSYALPQFVPPYAYPFPYPYPYPIVGENPEPTPEPTPDPYPSY